MAQVNEPAVEFEELNGTIWSKTPDDILNLVIEEADKETQANWSRTGSAFHEVSSALLWKEVFINVKYLQTYWEWTRTQPPPSNVRPENGGIVDFLIRGPAHRDFHQRSGTLHGDIAASPRTRIRQLWLGSELLEARETAKITDQELEIVLGFFALFMVRLHTLRFFGALSQGSLGQIVKFGSLRHLYLGRSKYVTDTHTSGLRPVPWAKLSLDFTHISDMQSLRTLTISHLVTLEAPGLAKAIQHLQHLTLLSLSVHYIATATRDTSWLTVSPSGVSPLIPFLETLSSRGDEARVGARDGVAGGFPRRLQTLTLVDHYHSNLPSLHQILQSAIKPCENLRNLAITFHNRNVTQDFLRSLGFPVQQDGKIASWDRLCSGAGLKYSGGAAWECVIRYLKMDTLTFEITRVDSDEAA